MTNRLNRDNSIRLIKEALRRVTRSRYYRANKDGAIMLSLAALLSEWHESRKGEDFSGAEAVKFLEQRLRPFVPSLYQRIPDADPEPVDLKKWKDPVSGQTPPNPYTKGAGFSITEQGWLEKNEPRLAAYLKSIAEGGGLTFSALARQESEKRKRDRIRELKYDEAENSGNPYHGNNMSLQNTFQQLHGEEIADFYRWEATTPIELPWLGEKPSMTVMNKMFQNDPQLHAMVKSSIATAKQWASEVLAEAQVKQTDAESILGRRSE